MKKPRIPFAGKISHRNITTINAVLVLGGLFLMICAALWLPLLPVGLVSLIAGVYLDHVYWRCPRCFSSLPHRDRNIRICPHCGKKLYL